MELIWIRHGKTAGNLEKRYIGTTDEPLCEEGRLALSAKAYPAADVVIASPKKRCIESAALLYPGKTPVIYEELQECDFGLFEGKNYLELSIIPEYQRWIDSGGTLPFPGGESLEAFKSRCIRGFEAAVRTCSAARRIAFVVHGGTIMAVLERYAWPKRAYYDFQVENGCGYVTAFDGEKITMIEEL